MNLGESYLTRSGLVAVLDGVSSYFDGPKEITVYSGTVNNVSIGSWNANGELLSNNLFGEEEDHELDIVSSLHGPVENPGVYYFEFKKEVINGKQ